MSSYDETERPRLPNKKEKTMTGSQIASFRRGYVEMLSCSNTHCSDLPEALTFFLHPYQQRREYKRSQESILIQRTCLFLQGSWHWTPEYTDGRSYSCNSEISRTWNKSHKNISSILFLYILLPNLFSPPAPWRYLSVLNL